LSYRISSTTVTRYRIIAAFSHVVMSLRHVSLLQNISINALYRQPGTIATASRGLLSCFQPKCTDTSHRPRYGRVIATFSHGFLTHTTYRRLLSQPVVFYCQPWPASQPRQSRWGQAQLHTGVEFTAITPFAFSAPYLQPRHTPRQLPLHALRSAEQPVRLLIPHAAATHTRHARTRYRYCFRASYHTEIAGRRDRRYHVVTPCTASVVPVFHTSRRWMFSRYFDRTLLAHAESRIPGCRHAPPVSLPNFTHNIDTLRTIPYTAQPGIVSQAWTLPAARFDLPKTYADYRHCRYRSAITTADLSSARCW